MEKGWPPPTTSADTRSARWSRRSRGASAGTADGGSEPYETAKLSWRTAREDHAHLATEAQQAEGAAVNHADFYAGSIDRASTGTYISALLPGGYSNQLLVEPALPYPPSGAARCVVSSFDIYQNSAGNGICVLFFDCTTLPVAGAALFGNSDDTQNVKFIRPITPGGAIFGPVGAPGIRFNYGCGIIVATAATGNVALANENTLITVHYFSYDVAR